MAQLSEPVTTSSASTLDPCSAEMLLVLQPTLPENHQQRFVMELPSIPVCLFARNEFISCFYTEKTQQGMNRGRVSMTLLGASRLP